MEAALKAIWRAILWARVAHDALNVVADAPVAYGCNQVGLKVGEACQRALRHTSYRSSSLCVMRVQACLYSHQNRMSPPNIFSCQFTIGFSLPTLRSAVQPV